MWAGFVPIVRKDLRLELRSGESTIALIALSLLILVVLVLAFGPDSGERSALASGALWVALIYAGMLGAGRSLTAERESGCIRGLLMSPVEPATIYAAKLCVALITMAVAGLAMALMLVLFFNLEVGPGLFRMLPVFMMGAVGLAALCLLMAAISGRLRAGTLMLPVLAVPLFTPALIAGSKASAGLLAGMSFGAVAPWLKVLGAFDVLFVAAGYLLFEQVMIED